MKKISIIILSLLLISFVNAASLFVEPSVVDAGEDIFISVSPQGGEVYHNVYIYSSEGYYKSYIPLDCPSYKCTYQVNQTYTIPENWPNGVYSLKVYDYTQRQWITDTFNVTGSSIVLRNAEAHIYPKNVTPGQSFNLYVLPGSEGVYKYIYLYSQNRYIDTLTTGCPDYRCYDNISLSYTVPDNWPNGEYTLRVYDYTRRKYIEEKFYVSGSSFNIEPTNLDLSTNSLHKGEDLTISIDPGTYGTYKYLYLYKEGSYSSYMDLGCSNYKCYNTVSKQYNTSSLQPGNYQFKVYDYTDYKWISEGFHLYPERFCYDSDDNDTSIKGDIFYYENGTNVSIHDACLDNTTLVERSCNGVYPENQFVECEYGCSDGACQEQPPTPCLETDSGLDYYVQGNNTYTYQDITYNVVDNCKDATRLQEWVCESLPHGNFASSYDYDCPYGCQDGACQEQVVDTCLFWSGNNVICNDGSAGPWCAVDSCEASNLCGRQFDNGMNFEVCTGGCQDGDCNQATQPFCYDSDGNNTFNKGTVYYNENGTNASVQDNCIDNSTLVEIVCDGESPGAEVVSCQYMCEDGACIPQPSGSQIDYQWYGLNSTLAVLVVNATSSQPISSINLNYRGPDEHNISGWYTWGSYSCNGTNSCVKDFHVTPNRGLGEYLYQIRVWSGQWTEALTSYEFS